MNSVGTYPLGQYRTYTFGRDMIIRDTGHQVFEVTPKTARHVDTVLLSAYSWKHVYEIPHFLRLAGLIRRPDKVLIGGFLAYNPLVLAPYCRGVFIGDADYILDDIINGNHESIYMGAGPVPWRHVDDLDGRGLEKGRFTMEIARGCRHSCTFCSIAALKKYRELPADEIEVAVRSTKKSVVTLFGPNAGQHSEADRISEICRKYHKQRYETDCRVEDLYKMPGKTPRTGLDGISEKLRQDIKKPRTTSSVVEAFRRAFAAGVRSFWVYIVLDLPGESADDWLEFRDLLHRIGDLPEAKQVRRFRIKPTTLQPVPFTELENAPIRWSRDYRAVVRDGLGIGRMDEPPPYKLPLGVEWNFYSPGLRVLQMVATRAGSEFAEIERRLTQDRLIKVKDGRVEAVCLDKILRVLGDYGGVAHYCGIPKRTPWREAVAIE